MPLTHPLLFKSLCYVDGQWVHSGSGASIAVQNPATRETIGHVPMLEQAQIVAAIDAAERAFPRWRDERLDTRAGLLRRWASAA